jgi:signal transduction histidine kinase
MEISSMKLTSPHVESQKEAAMERAIGWTDTRDLPLDRVVAQLAVHFMGVDRDGVDDAVELGLERIGKALGARGGTVVVLDEKRGTIARSHEWNERSGHVPKTCRRGQQIECLLWLRERLARGEGIEISGLGGLPDEAAAERRALSRRGIGSGLMLPLTIDGRSVGFLAFAGRDESCWSDDEVALVELAAEMFSRMFERCRIEELRWTRVHELERTSAALEEFAYHAAHDLKAPLTAIAGYLDLLRRSHGDKLDDAARDLIERADRSAGRLNGLIDALLVYSSLGIDELRLGVTDCQSLLGAICEDLETMMRDRDATIVADPLPKVVADPPQLRRVFENLLVNALKFGGTAPRVKLAAEETEEGYVFTVADRGPGIDPNDHGRIFEPFERLASIDPQPGSGLGLSICKKIIEQHGGRIWVDSHIGKGAAFRFVLPRLGVTVGW